METTKDTKAGSGKLDIAALGALLLVVLAFFCPLILAGQWIPRGGGDLVSFLWPMYRFTARSLRAGTIPLWNPFLYSGAPFVADNQTGVFYPLNLLAFALLGEPSYAVMEGLVVFHMWLAGVNMYALLRGTKLGRPAALFGGIAFALSDLFVTHVGNLNLNATAAWLPLLLLLTHRALTEKRAAWAAGAGAVLAIAALAGHGQMLLFLALALGAYFICRLVADSTRRQRAESKQQETRGKRVLGLGWRATLIVIVGIGGSALMLLPAQEMAAHTGRGHLPYEEATHYSLPPKALIGLLAPDFYGRGIDGFWGGWDRVEVGYAGAATLILAVVGLSKWASGQRRGFPGGFFVLLAVGGLALAMGRYTPFYGLLYRYAPTFDQVRAPARLIVLANLGLAALAAYGLDRLLSDTPAGHTPTRAGIGALAAGGIALAVGLPLARAVPPPDRVEQATISIVVAAALLGLSGALAWLTRVDRRIGWLLVPLLAIDLIGLGAMLEVEPNDPTLGFRHQDVVDFLHQDTGLFRIEATAGGWQPDAATVHGLYDIGGVFNPLGLAPYHAYRWAVGERGTPLYNLLGVKYVLTDKGKPPGDERLTPVYTENPEIDVYLNLAALPRALLVHDTQMVEDHAAAWQAIHAQGFDPTKTVILEKAQITDSGSQIADCESCAGDSSIAFVQYELNTVELAVETSTAGWLVLSDVYYPGWRATVDDLPASVLRADYTFRAVQVPAGQHTIRMTFAPWTWQLGLAISLVTWIGLAVWTSWHIRKRLIRQRI